MTEPPEGTLRLPNADARQSVVNSLQIIARRHSPGSYAYERADQAIGLALSRDRDAKSAPYLMRNVGRDARHILKRKKQSNPSEVFFSSIEAGLAASADGEAVPASTETVLPAARSPEPIDQLIADELEGMVREAVQDLFIGEDCLDAMLANESPGDTAARLGVPIHQVWRTRCDIRERAQILIA